MLCGCTDWVPTLFSKKDLLGVVLDMCFSYGITPLPSLAAITHASGWAIQQERAESGTEAATAGSEAEANQGPYS
jgi:hypothetical protein